MDRGLLGGRVVLRRWGLWCKMRGEKGRFAQANCKRVGWRDNHTVNKRGEVGKLTFCWVFKPGARGTIVHSKFGRCASRAFHVVLLFPCLAYAREKAQTVADLIVIVMRVLESAEMG